MSGLLILAGVHATYAFLAALAYRIASCCAARVAQAYGEHPETALTRMRWALTEVASAFGRSPAAPAHAHVPGHYPMTCTSRAA